MKKFLFSLTMLAAVALAGFTTSCGGNDDTKDDMGDEMVIRHYTSSLNIQTGMPGEELENLGTITEDVKIELNKDAKNLKFSINGLDLSQLDNIPGPLQAPFDIVLTNVPYTENNGVYEINYTLPIDEINMSTDVSIKISDNNAYLVSLTGNIIADKLTAQTFVFGDEGLLYIPVNIFVEGEENMK